MYLKSAKMNHPFSSDSLNCLFQLSGLTFLGRFMAYSVVSMLNMHKILATGREAPKNNHNILHHTIIPV